jgi:hypothetical protein
MDVSACVDHTDSEDESREKPSKLSEIRNSLGLFNYQIH